MVDIGKTEPIITIEPMPTEAPIEQPVPEKEKESVPA